MSIDLQQGVSGQAFSHDGVVTDFIDGACSPCFEREKIRRRIVYHVFSFAKTNVHLSAGKTKKNGISAKQKE